MTSPLDNDEAQARQRYMALNGIRIGSLGAVMLGIAGARGIVDLPYALAVALAVAGLLSFYFIPRQLARKWKSDAGEDPK